MIERVVVFKDLSQPGIIIYLLEFILPAVFPIIKQGRGQGLVLIHPNL